MNIFTWELHARSISIHRRSSSRNIISKSITYLFLEEAPKVLDKENFCPGHKPAGILGFLVHTNVRPHHKRVRVGHTTVECLRVNTVYLSRNSPVPLYLDLFHLLADDRVMLRIEKHTIVKM